MTESQLLQLESQEKYESAASVRATPEEVAEAIAAIELKREGLATDSIAIGEAIKQLSLDATPDELLAEINSRRTASRTKTAKPQLRWRKRLAILAILASLGLNVALTVSNRNLSRRVSWSSSQASGYVYRTSIADAMTNGHPFYATLDDLRRLAKLSTGERLRDDHRYPTEWTESQTWQVVPLEDGLYVRGWHDLRTTFTIGATSVQNSDGLLLSQPHDSTATTKTVPIGKFKELHDPKFLVPSPVVDGVTYTDRHGEAVELK